MHKKISFLMMSEKGFRVLTQLIVLNKKNLINIIVAAKDKNLENDYYNEIKSLCLEYNIIFFDKKECYEHLLTNDYIFTIGWRWIISGNIKNNLIISHYSLLPKYRGFSPLVNMLINHEKTIGVTFLFADDEYDCGEIIIQKKKDITYPIKIKQAIHIISILLFECIIEIIDILSYGKELPRTKQKNKDASYSLWRNEDDYLIDFKKSSTYIKRFIDSVGPPYLGASMYMDNKKIRVFDADIIDDVVIENRDPGKVIFMKNGFPVITCGSGLLLLKDLIDEETNKSILPTKKFRLKFQGKKQ